jgi:predicted RNA-binding protein with RPS1 domain
MGHGYIEKPEDVVKIGDEMQVQVVGIDRRRGRVDLSIKELIPPPQPAATQATEIPEALQVSFLEDGEESFVSPFELALQEARGNSGERRRDRRKKSRSYEYDEEEDDIISRTFAHHHKSKGGY